MLGRSRNHMNRACIHGHSRVAGAITTHLHFDMTAGGNAKTRYLRVEEFDCLGFGLLQVDV